MIWTVSKYADRHCITDLEKDLSKDDWLYIAELIPGVSAASCMFKWLSIKKVNLSVKSWLPFEENLLRNIVEEHLTPHSNINNLNWKIIS